MIKTPSSPAYRAWGYLPPYSHSIVPGGFDPNPHLCRKQAGEGGRAATEGRFLLPRSSRGRRCPLPGQGADEGELRKACGQVEPGPVTIAARMCLSGEGGGGCASRPAPSSDHRFAMATFSRKREKDQRCGPLLPRSSCGRRCPLPWQGADEGELRKACGQVEPGPVTIAARMCLAGEGRGGCASRPAPLIRPSLRDGHLSPVNGRRISGAAPLLPLCETFAKLR